MSDDIIFISNNIAIVQSQDSVCSLPSTISTQELSEYGIVALPVVTQSVAIVEDKYANVRLVFGAWVESGDEDKQLEELYRSRLIPSASLRE